MIPRRFHPFRAAVLVAAGLLPLLPGAALAENPAPLETVQYQLQTDCMCASCQFATEAELHKLPGVTKVALSQREKTLEITFDESKLPLSRLSDTVAHSELGLHSVLVGELPKDASAPAPAAVKDLPGVATARVDGKSHRILLTLAPGATVTVAELTAAIDKSAGPVRINRMAPAK